MTDAPHHNKDDVIVIDDCVKKSDLDSSTTATVASTAAVSAVAIASASISDTGKSKKRKLADQEENVNANANASSSSPLKKEDIMKKDNVVDTWSWIHNLTFQDCIYAMPLHRSTRKIWNSYEQIFTNLKKKKVERDLLDASGQECLNRMIYWIAVFWANKHDFGKWETDEEEMQGGDNVKDIRKLRKKLRTKYLKSQKGGGGQGMKKLQRLFYESKYPNLFSENLDETQVSETPEVKKKGKTKKSKKSASDNEHNEHDEHSD